MKYNYNTAVLILTITVITAILLEIIVAIRKVTEIVILLIP